MAAARNGSATKIRRSAPIFHRPPASPSDGGGSTGTSTVSGGRPPRAPARPARSPPSARSAGAARAVPRAGSRGRQPDQDDDDDRHREDEERRPREKTAESPAPMSTPAIAPRLMRRTVRRVDARSRRDGVVVGQQRVMGREDHGLPHRHARDGRPHDCLRMPPRAMEKAAPRRHRSA